MRGKLTHRGRRRKGNRRVGSDAIRGPGIARRAGWPSTGMVIGCSAPDQRQRFRLRAYGPPPEPRPQKASGALFDSETGALFGSC